MLYNSENHIIFVSVFHRILDFKAGLDFYLGPFFILYTLSFCLKRDFAIFVRPQFTLCHQVIEHLPYLFLFYTFQAR